MASGYGYHSGSAKPRPAVKRRTPFFADLGVVGAILVISLLLVLLSGCSGTALQFAGPLCGAPNPATISLSDRKDRAGFNARCTHTTYAPDGSVTSVSEVTITSSESNTSEVIRAQAEAIDKLAGLVRLSP
jgi:hypothetical protein